jgi:hypothetical protein
MAFFIKTFYFYLVDYIFFANQYLIIILIILGGDSRL